ncbi:MAG: DUF2110 family protein [Candidatus Bathyarchaeia archaeon]
MLKVTLPTKVYNNFQTEIVNKFLKSMLKGLNANAKVVGVTSRGLVEAAISGEDENVALQYLEDEIGVCPENLDAVKKFSTLKGRITALGKSKSEIYVDVGVHSPTIVDAIIPLQRLQAQLADGRKIALKKLVELFGFCENLPLTIKILDADKDKNRIEAALAEEQLNKYKVWTKSLLDRLIVLGSSESEIKLALKEIGLKRDVIAVETLGFFEHALTCKFGTDAAGLIAKVGRKLPNTSLTIFSPRKLIELLGNVN